MGLDSINSFDDTKRFGLTDENVAELMAFGASLGNLSKSEANTDLVAKETAETMLTPEPEVNSSGNRCSFGNVVLPCESVDSHREFEDLGEGYDDDDAFDLDGDSENLNQPVADNADTFNTGVDNVLKPIFGGNDKVSNNANTAYSDSKVIQFRSKALNQPAPQVETETMYQETTTMSCGKAYKYEIFAKKVSWGKTLQGDNTDMNTIRLLVTDYISKSSGGFKNIRQLLVRDGLLIIDGVCSVVRIDKDAQTLLPRSVVNYLNNACLAPYFDWGYLTKMSGLVKLDFDSMDTVFSWVLPLLGWSGVSSERIPEAFFENCKSLRILCIGNNITTRDDYLNRGAIAKDTKEKASKAVKALKENADYELSDAEYQALKRAKYMRKAKSKARWENACAKVNSPEYRTWFEKITGHTFNRENPLLMRPSKWVWGNITDKVIDNNNNKGILSRIGSFALLAPAGLIGLGLGLVYQTVHFGVNLATEAHYYNEAKREEEYAEKGSDIS